ncbi:MAG: terminase small subunit [Gammaproteobacteria bacterium]|nr:terminase small subunit [Gammaproteobacteria bacterium]
MSNSRNEYGLSDKQQVFCDLYRASDDPEILGNAKRCYQLAYGCKPESAEHNGPRLLKDENVAQYLEMKRTAAMKEADITEARIVEELACMAFLDPGEYYEEDGSLKKIHEMPERARRALQGLESTEVILGSGEDASVAINKKVKYSDKKPSLELLMKWKGMLKEKVEHSGSVGGVMLFPNDVSPEEWQRQHFQQPADQKGK